MDAKDTAPAARRGGDAAAAPSSDGFDCKSLALMDRVADKLQALDYAEGYLDGAPGRRPISRVYFAGPAPNVSLQVSTFMDLVSWLFEQATGDPEAFTVDQYDDPNTSVNKMMLALRKVNFNLDFPAAKLKSGCGEAVVSVLDFVTDVALERRAHAWRPHEPQDELNADEADVDEEADLGEISDDMDTGAVEEEPMFEDLVAEADGVEAEALEKEAHEIMHSDINAVDWKKELERVGPRLKVALTGGNEWRQHIEQTKKHEGTIASTLPTAKTQLTAMSQIVGDAIERVRSNEAKINSQFEPQRTEYKLEGVRLLELEKRRDEASNNVTELTNTYNSKDEALKELSTTLKSNQNALSDSSPLLSIKEALVKIKKEIKHFELRIGVVGHTLLQVKMRTSKDSKQSSRKKPSHADDFDDDSDLDA